MAEVDVGTDSFIHSFGHFYSSPSSPILLRGAPDYSTDTLSEFHAEAHRQLYVKDLPKVPTWRLEAMMHFPPCFRFPPLFPKNFSHSAENFPNLTFFPKIFRFSSAKIFLTTFF